MPILHQAKRFAAAASCALLCGCLGGCLLASNDPPTVIQATDPAADTAVAIDLQQPITPNTNVVWCGTIQLAWDQLAKMYGGKVPFAGPIPAAAQVLNQQNEVAPAVFDPTSYVALADTVGDGVYAQIEKAMQETFHGSQHSDLLKQMNVGGEPGNSLVAFAFLYKKLQFPTPFEHLKKPIQFQGHPVIGFGIQGDPDKPDEEDLAHQVELLSYQDADHFVIQLDTTSPSDRLILAKVAPADTLAKTIERVQSQIASSKARQLGEGVPLEVPKVAFDITHDFDELIGHELRPAPPRIPAPLEISVAKQIIKFEMNERGVRLQSEFWAKALGDIEQPLIFDKPFLILMQRAGSNRPYLAAWIGNARLLVAAR